MSIITISNITATVRTFNGNFECEKVEKNVHFVIPTSPSRSAIIIVESDDSKECFAYQVVETINNMFPLDFAKEYLSGKELKDVRVTGQDCLADDYFENLGDALAHFITI